MRGMIYLKERKGTREQALADFEKAASLGFKQAEEVKKQLLKDILPTSLDGPYDAQGANPDGSRYSGRCDITRIGSNEYHFQWHVGTSHIGIGRVVGDTVTVDWGSGAPVIYKLQADGSPVGTWAKGTATETLRRME